MTRPLLETKLYAPHPRGTLVSRPRLAERLASGAESKLTLISAPAGFGKTTLLAEWLESQSDGRSVAWLSLDPADNEPTAFWTYVSESLDRATPTAEAARSLLEETQAPIETVLTALLNGLSQTETDVVLVLDDYHVIDAPEIQEQMTFLVDHLPPNAHLVIATRADPALPLPRLRARGELTEIRATDLRFTPDEATMYFEQAAGLALDPPQVEALEHRTEGWIAALQLAALSLRGRHDVQDFIADFTGDHRFVVDYLVEEVLQRQAGDVRTFLLETSILDRLTGPLCDAVTGRSDGRATLETLERSNLFVIPLDAHREWYRYHHLFADVLRAHLLHERTDGGRELHQRASRWFEENGDRPEAIRHALAGEDFERAADLIEPAIAELRQGRQVATMRRWIEAIPDELLRHRPVLNAALVGALLANGEVLDIDDRLRDAEQGLEQLGADGPVVVVDRFELARLPATLAMYRAAQAQMVGDLARAEVHARRALGLAGDEDPLGRGAAAGFLALGHWTRGDLEAAHDLWADAAANLQAAGHLVDAIGCTRPMAVIRAAQGHLHEAFSTYEQGLKLATASSGVLRGAADLHVGMSELMLEWNDLDAAADSLRQSQDLGEQGGLPRNAYRWRVAMALLRQAEGGADAALALLHEAERAYVSEYYPDVQPIGAVIARIQAAQGRLREATTWVRERGLSVHDDLTYLHEYEHITLARVLMAEAGLTHDDRPMRGAATFLDRLLEAAEAGGRGRSLVEILVLQALATHDLGRGTAGLSSLERALALAKPEGYVRTFAAEGAPMGGLLTMAATHGMAPGYVRQLLDALGRGDGAAAGNRRLEEPLSKRELEILRLLASDLDGPAIASELVVALSTVRSHTKSIYAKLGVNSRRAALRRAEELGLLKSARR